MMAPVASPLQSCPGPAYFNLHHPPPAAACPIAQCCTHSGFPDCSAASLCTALLLGSSAALQEMHVDAAAADRCVQLLLQQMPQCRFHYNTNSSSSIGAYRWETKLIG